MLRYATEIFRFALNDKHVENPCIPWVKINAARSVPTYKQPFFVIQRSIATKDLGSIYFLLRYATGIFRT